MDSQIDERIDAVRDALPELDADPAVNCYWITGSLTAGLGTKTSDLDIIVVTTADADHGAGGIRAGQYPVAARRVDIEVHPLEWLRELVDAVGVYTASTADTTQLFTPAPILKVVAQLHAGVRIVKDSPQLAATCAALHDGEADFRRLLIARAAMYANNTLEDLVGFIADGDLDSALLRARDLLMFGLDAWAVACGEAYPGTKWIWRRLGRIVTDPAALSQIRDLLLPADLATGFSHLHRINALNQTLLAQALLLSWATKPPATTQPVVPDMAAAGIWRTPGWTPNRMTDHWRLTDRRVEASLPFTAMICWAFANGLVLDELVGAVVRWSAAWFDTQITRATALSVVTRLTELGALAEGHLDDIADAFYAREVA